MVTSNLKNYSDEDIIALVEGFEQGSISYNLNDLKSVLSEVTSRKMEQKYIDLLAEKIKTELETAAKAVPNPAPRRQQAEAAEPAVEQQTQPVQPQPVEETTVPVTPVEPVSPVIQPVEEMLQPEAFEREEEQDKFPILSFIAGLYRVFGWIALVASMIAGGIVCRNMFLESTIMMVGVMLAAVTLGIIFVIGFYAAAEKINLKLEIERHLRYIRNAR